MPRCHANFTTTSAAVIDRRALLISTGVHNAHFQLDRRGTTGHEKPMPTPWAAALLTRAGSSTEQFAVLQKAADPRIVPLIPQMKGEALSAQTAWARASLQCPTIRRLEYGQSGPLTVGGFFSNIAHAFANSTVRIPPDPETAYHQFCGPGTPISLGG